VSSSRQSEPGATRFALLVVSLTLDGPIHGPAQVAVWVLPTIVGTELIRRWHRRLAAA
jgi:hypothetical protein